jgi:hypothetical protein
MIARDHYSAIAREAGENGEGRLSIEKIIWIQLWDMLAALGEGWNLEVRINSKNLTR